MDTCPTCGRPAGDPYRQYSPVSGKVISGCVDAFHDGHLVVPSESSAWHNRKIARVHRAAIARENARMDRELKRLARMRKKNWNF